MEELCTEGLATHGDPESCMAFCKGHLGCNYDCEHCCLGDKQFAGMDGPGREHLLDVMAQAGVLWLPLAGGEPLIDPLFADTHARAFHLSMMIQISSNGSRLDQPCTLDLLTGSGGSVWPHFDG